jgi:hypothetical protein
VSGRKKFDQWCHEEGLTDSLAKMIALRAWQASRRAALEEAANHITRGIDGVKQNGWIDAANERLRCADAIRALAKETNNG